MARSSNPARRLERRVRKLRREARHTARRAERRARELADDAVVLGVGAPAYAMEKVGKAARDAIDAPSRRTASRGGASNADTRAYEERTREELYALARERDVPGRSRMSKRQLIAALRR